MNSSTYGYNVLTVLTYRDSYSTAVAKNVIVLALGLSINYINAALIHTFRKHQVKILFFFFFAINITSVTVVTLFTLYVNMLLS